MYGLTPMQRRLLDIVALAQARGEQPPTYRTLTSLLDLRSTSGVHRLLSGLAERGALRWQRACARSIEVTPDGMALAFPIVVAGERFRFLPVACLGSIGDGR